MGQERFQGSKSIRWVLMDGSVGSGWARKVPVDITLVLKVEINCTPIFVMIER
jgi:hypothetical protein